MAIEGAVGNTADRRRYSNIPGANEGSIATLFVGVLGAGAFFALVAIPDTQCVIVAVTLSRVVADTFAASVAGLATDSAYQCRASVIGVASILAGVGTETLVAERSSSTLSGNPFAVVRSICFAVGLSGVLAVLLAAHSRVLGEIPLAFVLNIGFAVVEVLESAGVFLTLWLLALTLEPVT